MSELESSLAMIFRYASSRLLLPHTYDFHRNISHRLKWFQIRYNSYHSHLEE